MSEKPATGPAAQAEAPAITRIVLRSWPKIILLIPTLVTALVCGVFMAFHGTPPPDADFGAVHIINLVFLAVLLVNLTVLLYDLNLRGFIIVCLCGLVLVLLIFLLNAQLQGGAWQAIGQTLSVRVYANSAFYLLFSLALGINLSIAWVITRFNYWVVERNEVIIHRGLLSEQERHPTAQTRFKLVIDDVVEYALFGCGRLVFYFGDNQSQVELPTVLFVHRKARVLDELLGRIAVTEK